MNGLSKHSLKTVWETSPRPTEKTVWASEKTYYLTRRKNGTTERAYYLIMNYATTEKTRTAFRDGGAVVAINTECP